jgi:hypothetical protein
LKERRRFWSADRAGKRRNKRLRREPLSAPVYPGETLITDIWQDGEELFFRTRVPERDLVVLNNGHAVLRGPDLKLQR